MPGHLEHRLETLKSLPELVPPADLEQATLAAMAKAAARRRRHGAVGYFARAASWVVAIGVGAWIGAWVMSNDEPVAEPQRSRTDDVYFQLAEQSMLLEEVLAVMPPPRRVIRAETASTIVGLENRIAWIDAALYRTETETEAAPPEYRVALMRDRVEVMNALVHVRYAQSRAFIF
jgi:hypothetical protein